QSFGILSTIPGRPLICWLSRAVSSSLLDGEDFVRALDRPELDRTLVRFIRIAVHSSDMEDMLDAYTALTEERIRQRCRRIAGVIQLIAYAMIGVMIILVYRIMLLPLSLMMQI
ncbi:MAG: type II secretion system F family protein, partial [Solobacterium sp.]|nr:type II secretion system F family protein [Solobacterium sp.]